MIYFVTTKKEGGRLRVFPLAGQNAVNNFGNALIDPKMHVQCSADVRNAYPEGTVFATDSLVSVGNKFYAAGDICPVTEDVTIGRRPTVEMTDKWNEYKAQHPDWNSSTDGDIFGGLFSQNEPEKPAAPAPAKAAPAPAPKMQLPLVERLRKEYPCPDIAHDGFYVDPLVWDLLLRNTESGENTIIYGCQGLGKTELVLTLGKRLGKPVKVYDMGSMHDPMSQMLGTHRLVSDGKNTVSKFDPARFTQDIQEDCIVLLDELNRAPTTTLNILMPLLDSRRTLPVEMAAGDEARNITVHPRCRFIATANIGSRHVGTLPIDPALFSRFLPVELKQMDASTEAALLMKRTGIEMKDARAICNIAEVTRRKTESGELSVEMSPRETLRCAGLIRDGFPLLQALELAFLYVYSKDEREIVKRMFATR